MASVPIDVLARNPAPRQRLTRRDYHRLGEAGILDEGDRVDRLDGRLVDMSPIGPRHAIVTDNLMDLLVLGFLGRAQVRCQQSVVLDDGSEPQPDVALVRRPWRGSPHTQPELRPYGQAGAIRPSGDCRDLDCRPDD